MTHDQQIASDPAISAWVSASAGTGKTKVLTDRVLRLLLSGAPPSKILCITYTRAASAEMESRISTELGRWVSLPDKALAEALAVLTGVEADAKMLAHARRLFAEVQEAPERIRIQTIHSFCQQVLARFPLEAGVPPHFTLINDIASRELLGQARAMLLSDAGRPGATALAEAVTELAAVIGEASLRELARQIVSQRRKFSEWFDGESDPARIYAALGVAPGMDEEALAQMHLRYTPQEEEALKRACEVLAQGGGKSDRQTHDALRIWLLERADAMSYARAYVTLEGNPRKTLFTKDCERIWPELTQVLAAEQRRMCDWFQMRQTLRIAKLSAHVATLGRAMLDRYQQLKTRHGFLDYDDLILRTVALLHRPGVAPWVLFKLDGGIDHLLIDEAQDTAPEQWRIVDALAQEFFAGEGARSVKRTLFVVGDEKQSIFSFQGADPQGFDRMQGRLSKLAAGAEHSFRRVQLALSFRSTQPVLQAVDSVFTLDAARDGLIFGESDIRHEASRLEAKGRVELWPLMETPDEETLPAWHIAEKPSAQEHANVQCAGQIAATIAGWLSEKRMLASQGRLVRPGDIMILLQRRGAFADILLRLLKRRHIPVAGADRLLLTGHIAVMDCMALARFLLLPQDDLTLAEVLRSPFVGLSEEALFELAHGRGEEALWERLKKNPAYGEAHTYLSDLLSVTDYMPPYELFAYVLEAKGGRRKLAARLGGEMADPLNEFLTLALEYGKTYPPTLEGFIHWLEAGDIEIKRDMEKGRDEVRILTVHGAKGLQAPIVFLPDTTRMPLHDSGIVWNNGNETVPLFSPGKDADNGLYRALRDARRVEAEREYRRLLYVALTRAEDELYICGWKGSRAVPEACWYELVRLASEGWQADGDKRVLMSEQLKPVEAKPVHESMPDISGLPQWAQKSAPSEPVPAKPLSPSRLAPASDMLPPQETATYERGLLVHRLLQYLPEVAAGERTQAMERFFARYGGGLSLEEKEQVGQEVLAILGHPQFAPVFGPGSVAEASIAGVADKGVTIAGRIDRLAVLERDVYIIDYKTGRKVPGDASAIPETYLRQMEAYRQLVKGIYPDKTVHCALLWTAEPKLILVSDALLQRIAA